MRRHLVGRVGRGRRPSAARSACVTIAVRRSLHEGDRRACALGPAARLGVEPGVVGDHREQPVGPGHVAAVRAGQADAVARVGRLAVAVQVADRLAAHDVRQVLGVEAHVEDVVLGQRGLEEPRVLHQHVDPATGRRGATASARSAPPPTPPTGRRARRSSPAPPRSSQAPSSLVAAGAGAAPPSSESTNAATSAASWPVASPAGITPPPAAILASATSAGTCVMFGPVPPVPVAPWHPAQFAANSVAALRDVAGRRRRPVGTAALGSNGVATAITTTTTLTAAPITQRADHQSTPNSPKYQTLDVSHSTASSAATVPPSTGSAHDGWFLVTDHEHLGDEHAVDERAGDGVHRDARGSSSGSRGSSRSGRRRAA